LPLLRREFVPPRVAFAFRLAIIESCQDSSDVPVEWPYYSMNVVMRQTGTGTLGPMRPA
jgi:hypothetical protein